MMEIKDKDSFLLKEVKREANLRVALYVFDELMKDPEFQRMIKEGDKDEKQG